MKKGVTILLMALLLKGASGQLSIQSVMPASGLVQKSQLWNLVIINNSSQEYKVVIDLVLTDRITGLEIMTASTGRFDIGKGTRQLNPGLLQPIQYNYLAGWIDNRTSEMLPIGLYTACYRLSHVISNKTFPLAEDCIQFDVEPLSPPMLIHPADSAVLEKAPQQFSWIPPTPASLFSNLHYEVIITELLNGQKAPEAIQDNIPFFLNGSVYVSNMPYTASSIPFEVNKWYAWQVVARDNSTYAAKSETWVFKVRDSLAPLPIVASPYIKLEPKAGEVSIVKKGMLKMEYYNYLPDSTVKVWIYNEKEKNDYQKNNKPIIVRVVPGQNLLQLNLGRKIQAGNNSIFEAVLINSKRERFFMKFKNTD